MNQRTEMGVELGGREGNGGEASALQAGRPPERLGHLPREAAETRTFPEGRTAFRPRLTWICYRF